MPSGGHFHCSDELVRYVDSVLIEHIMLDAGSIMLDWWVAGEVVMQPTKTKKHEKDRHLHLVYSRA